MAQYAAAPYRVQEINLPPLYWNALSQDDKIEFQRLRTLFHKNQKTSTKDRRLVSFSNELQTVLKYLEHSASGRENRTILVGVCFAGQFICVNTRQLKNFLGRCKSSINGSLQQLGYVALKTKSKARTVVLSIIPSLANDANVLRQWTVRVASNDAQICFLSSIRSIQLPTITDEDINDDKKQITNPQGVQFYNTAHGMPLALPPRISPQFTQQMALPKPQESLIPQEPTISSKPQQYHDMTISYSVDCFDGWETKNYENDWNPVWDNQQMAHSQSTEFDIGSTDYSLF
ncbi:hypothetical protein TVAG_077950 [Trichomonas vaginalis G3]|uniref:Initiator binding domain-containing protein n=1 Tax=Trichomonas vaginalis (strain ATCC PRA-98 / G3) TaxID=412133 RepID=A2FGM9_TRIV3|nr:transcription-initiator DNA-binding domain ibd family [Trichomonas vaginalis G3]EAX95953.1 hypothetical protein TVAG_077950 [Trichomonas vaginalis G3]KAI5492659.1 transcription-initiator DNA-binding domain ibd family [Trichomonas vaginalis G3]|eukprot:XP_001308883.1 hypothetical protein [Trichomonas vaginalis G3]